MQHYTLLDRPEALSAIFYPQKSGPSPLPKNAVDVDIEVEQGIIIGCRYHIHSPESPNILFFHGNGETISDYDTIGPMYNKAGMNLLLAEYRGYGWSGGSPTVTTMLKDAELTMLETINWLNFNKYSGSLFLMGRSLGSVPAIELAMNHEDKIKGLILESAIADTLPLARRLGMVTGPEEFTEDDGFGNLKKIESVTKPTFIMHGALDDLITAAEAEKLQSHSGARTKEFVIIPGAEHNSMIAVGGSLYFQTIKTFIDKITGASNWRKRRKAGKNMQEN